MVDRTSVHQEVERYLRYTVYIVNDSRMLLFNLLLLLSVSPSMENISDLKIAGIDELRRPVIRTEPYIELFFRLNHKAPKAWCRVFNDTVSKSAYSMSIKIEDGLFIETWVRKKEEIVDVLKTMQAAVKSSIEQYIDQVEARSRASSTKSSGEEATGEQLELNQIIDSLDFK